jgi:hypothetical protein
MNEMGGSCSTHGRVEGAYRVLAGKREGKNPLGRPMIRWEDNIKWAFKKWDGDLDWIDLAQDGDR